MHESLVSNEYIDRDIAILKIARSKKVLHLGCIGSTDLPSEERIQLVNKGLHWKLSEIANVTGVDYSKDVVGELSRLGVFNNIIYGNVERLDSKRLILMKNSTLWSSRISLNISPYRVRYYKGRDVFVARIHRSFLRRQMPSACQATFGFYSVPSKKEKIM